MHNDMNIYMHSLIWESGPREKIILYGFGFGFGFEHVKNIYEEKKLFFSFTVS